MYALKSCRSELNPSQIQRVFHALKPIASPILLMRACVGMITPILLIPNHESSSKYLLAGLGHLDTFLDEIVTPDGDVAKVNGQVLATLLTEGVALVADGDGLVGDAITAGGEVAREHLEKG